ncbi:MAG: methyltransferase domain-containing protein, partial [Candidatus Omnitrophica bacterium]|nr:methyltransferase domain-containing protein [Candidatus Omnitrophota bacterium]
SAEKKVKSPDYWRFRAGLAEPKPYESEEAEKREDITIIPFGAKAILTDAKTILENGKLSPSFEFIDFREHNLRRNSSSILQSGIIQPFSGGSSLTFVSSSSLDNSFDDKLTRDSIVLILQKHFGRKKALDILDLGSGRGEFIIDFAESLSIGDFEVRIQGVEINNFYVEEAVNLGVKVREMAIEKAVKYFGKNSQDIVTIIAPDSDMVRKALTAAYCLARVNGLIILRLYDYGLWQQEAMSDDKKEVMSFLTDLKSLGVNHSVEFLSNNPAGLSTEARKTLNPIFIYLSGSSSAVVSYYKTALFKAFGQEAKVEKNIALSILNIRRPIKHYLKPYERLSARAKQLQELTSKFADKAYSEYISRLNKHFENYTAEKHSIYLLRFRYPQSGAKEYFILGETPLAARDYLEWLDINHSSRTIQAAAVFTLKMPVPEDIVEKLQRVNDGYRQKKSGSPLSADSSSLLDKDVVNPSARTASLVSDEPAAASPVEQSSSSTGFIEGLLFRPTINFEHGTKLTPKVIRKHIKTTRNAAQVRELLRTAKEKDIKVSIEGHLRGIDGPGSSLDLPEFQIKLTKKDARSIEEFPSTPTIASEFKLKIRFELADDPDSIEYIAPDYGIMKNNPFIVKKVKLDKNGRIVEAMTARFAFSNIIKLFRGKVKLNKNAQALAPAFILMKVFKLKGIRVICEEISAMARAGGMESSNVFNVTLFAGGSMLSGAGLSMADIFSECVKFENDELGGLTGGQGHLCCMLGGAYQHVWLSGQKNDQGQLMNPYSALSIPLLKGEESIRAIEEHTFLVQAAKVYKNGKPQVRRVASLTNNMWTDLLRDKDPIGFAKHEEKLPATARYTLDLARNAFGAASDEVLRYTYRRQDLDKRWLGLAIDAHRGVEGIPSYAYRYARRVWDHKHPDYEDYEVVRTLYEEIGSDLREISFYTLDPLNTLVEEGAENNIAIMPLGAGGPGANSIAMSAEDSEYMRRFFEDHSLGELQQEEVRSIMRGTGELKGYMPFKVGKEPLKISGFKELGLQLPEGPQKVIVRRDDITRIVQASSSPVIFPNRLSRKLVEPTPEIAKSFQETITYVRENYVRYRKNFVFIEQYRTLVPMLYLLEESFRLVTTNYIGGKYCIDALSSFSLQLSKHEFIGVVLHELEHLFSDTSTEYSRIREFIEDDDSEEVMAIAEEMLHNIESNADEFSVIVLADMGQDPYSYLSLLDKLRIKSSYTGFRERIIDDFNFSGAIDYFESRGLTTHPPLERRKENVKKTIKISRRFSGSSLVGCGFRSAVDTRFLDQDQTSRKQRVISSSSASIDEQWAIPRTHNPARFYYPVTVSGINEIIYPATEFKNNKFCFLSVISADFLNTFDGYSIGLVMEFPFRNIWAILRQTAEEIATNDVIVKDEKTILSFLEQHLKSYRDNVLYSRFHQEYADLTFTPEDIMFESMHLNASRLSSQRYRLFWDFVMKKKIPVIFTAEKVVNLEESKRQFEYFFPKYKNTSPNMYTIPAWIKVRQGRKQIVEVQGERFKLRPFGDFNNASMQINTQAGEKVGDIYGIRKLELSEKNGVDLEFTISPKGFSPYTKAYINTDYRVSSSATAFTFQDLKKLFRDIKKYIYVMKENVSESYLQRKNITVKNLNDYHKTKDISSSSLARERIFVQYIQELKKARAKIIYEEEKKAKVKAYHDFIERLLRIEDIEAQITFVYPLMGPDSVLARFRRTIPINKSINDFIRGESLLMFVYPNDADILGEICLNMQLRMSLNAWAKESYDIINKIEHEHLIFVLKGVFQFALDQNAVKKSKELLRYVFLNILQKGDKILVLDSKDSVYEPIAVKSGFSYLYKGKDIGSIISVIASAKPPKFLFLPNILRILEKSSSPLKNRGEVSKGIDRFGLEELTKYVNNVLPAIHSYCLVIEKFKKSTERNNTSLLAEIVYSRELGVGSKEQRVEGKEQRTERGSSPLMNISENKWIEILKQQGLGIVNIEHARRNVNAVGFFAKTLELNIREMEFQRLTKLNEIVNDGINSSSPVRKISIKDKGSRQGFAGRIRDRKVSFITSLKMFFEKHRDPVWNLDQMLRYEPVAQFIKGLRLSETLIIEVGIGQEGGLARYSEGVLDPIGVDLLAAGILPLGKDNNESRKWITADAAAIPVRHNRADVLVCLDMLEHVSTQQRLKIVLEMYALIREGGHLILGIPMGKQADWVESMFNRLYKLFNGNTYRWLDEHRIYGLPQDNEFKRLLLEAGIDDYRTVENNAVYLWPFSLWLCFILPKICPSLQKIVTKKLFYPLFSRFNTPGYRKIYFIRKNKHHQGYLAIVNFTTDSSSPAGRMAYGSWLIADGDIAVWQRAEDREQRAEDREQRAEDREQRAKKGSSSPAEGKPAASPVDNKNKYIVLQEFGLKRKVDVVNQQGYIADLVMQSSGKIFTFRHLGQEIELGEERILQRNFPVFQLMADHEELVGFFIYRIRPENTQTATIIFSGQSFCLTNLESETQELEEEFPGNWGRPFYVIPEHREDYLGSVSFINGIWHMRFIDRLERFEWRGPESDGKRVIENIFLTNHSTEEGFNVWVGLLSEEKSTEYFRQRKDRFKLFYISDWIKSNNIDIAASPASPLENSISSSPMARISSSSPVREDKGKRTASDLKIYFKEHFIPKHLYFLLGQLKIVAVAQTFAFGGQNKAKAARNLDIPIYSVNNLVEKYGDKINKLSADKIPGFPGKTLAELEKILIEVLLEINHGDERKTADTLRIDLSDLNAKLKKDGISTEELSIKQVKDDGRGTAALPVGKIVHSSEFIVDSSVVSEPRTMSHKLRANIGVSSPVRKIEKHEWKIINGTEEISAILQQRGTDSEGDETQWESNFFNYRNQHIGYLTFESYPFPEAVLEQANWYVNRGVRQRSYSKVFVEVMCNLSEDVGIFRGYRFRQTSSVFNPFMAKSLLSMGFMPQPDYKGTKCIICKPDAQGIVSVFFSKDTPGKINKKNFERRMRNKRNREDYALFRCLDNAPLQDTIDRKVILDVPYVQGIGASSPAGRMAYGSWLIADGDIAVCQRAEDREQRAKKGSSPSTALRASSAVDGKNKSVPIFARRYSSSPVEKDIKSYLEANERLMRRKNNLNSLNDVKDVLIKRRKISIFYENPSEDGFYLNATIKNHENEPRKSDKKWGVKTKKVEILYGSGGYFMRFGKYAIVSEPLRGYIPTQLWEKVLFLNDINGQLRDIGHGLEYCLPYLVNIYNSRSLFQGEHVLELGIGRGIAALFAIKLGAKMVVGIEKDQATEGFLRKEADLNKIDTNQVVFIKGKFDDRCMIEKLKPYGSFAMAMANIGPHGIYDEDCEIDFGLSWGLGQDGSNIKALELIYSLQKNKLLHKQFNHIGAGFNEELSEGRSEGSYSPGGEIGFLKKYFKITDIHTVIYRKHRTKYSINRLWLYHSYCATLDFKRKPNKSSSYNGYYGNILFEDFRKNRTNVSKPKAATSPMNSYGSSSSPVADNDQISLDLLKKHLMLPMGNAASLECQEALEYIERYFK